MIRQTQVKIIDGTKSGNSSKKVIDLVRQGDAISSGDIGAYIVGVFACQPLMDNGMSYDLSEKGQWTHCIFKEQWKAALHDEDKFTEEEKSLILAGEMLLTHPLLPKGSHGWGNNASTQPHVRKLLESWNSL
ncbi:MAG: hypothetical protein RIQ94_938 [Pseudomonadota bacterium]|jgi:hypothetical protein